MKRGIILTDRQRNILFLIIFSLCIITLFFILFNNLSANAIADWDEARHGINAYEMLNSNNWIVSTYKYEPDLWNLKPPISYYLIALSYLLFGFNSFSLRLYSAVSIVIIYCLVSKFLVKYSGKFNFLFFSLIFLSFGDFFYGHCGRTGDADALFLLFYVISVFSLIKARNNKSFLYLYGLGFSLAFLTKSFHAVPIFIIGVTYIFISKVFKELHIKNYILLIASATGPIIIWGIARYICDGMDFLGIMFGVDVTNRIASGQSSGGSYLGFIKYTFTYRPTQILLICAIVCYVLLAIIRKNWRFKLNDYRLMLILWFAITVVFFSLTRTIERWYYYPTFLCLILIVSSLLSCLVKNVLKMGSTKKLITIFSGALCLLIIVFSLYNIVSNIKSTFNITTTKAQNAIIDFSERNTDFDGNNCYFIKSESEDKHPYVIEKGVWEQSDVLSAELYGDYICKDGGVEGFIKDRKPSIIFVEKKLYSSYDSKLKEFEKTDVGNYYVINN